MRGRGNPTGVETVGGGRKKQGGEGGGEGGKPQVEWEQDRLPLEERQRPPALPALPLACRATPYLLLTLCFTLPPHCLLLLPHETPLLPSHCSAAACSLFSLRDDTPPSPYLSSSSVGIPLWEEETTCQGGTDLEPHTSLFLPTQLRRRSSGGVPYLHCQEEETLSLSFLYLIGLFFPLYMAWHGTWDKSLSSL